MGWTTTQRLKWTRTGLAFALAAAMAADPILAEAQEAPAAPPGTPDVEQPQAAKFTHDELLKLLAPIALYPDPLLAQMLPASAYPLQIVQAQRWLDKNKALVARNDFSGIDRQNWDPAVKAIARFPDVMLKMNNDLSWTTDLGDAFVNQPQDVADAIQQLRAEAETAGALTTTPQQTVNTVVSSTPQGEKTVIAIQPTDPSTVYVPSYAPTAVYAPPATSLVAPLLTFGAGVALGAAATGAYWNWNTGAVRPPTWARYPGYRPSYGGSRPVSAGNINTGNVNIGNDVTIGSGNGNQAWKPNNNYRPGQGSKPGIGNRPGDPYDRAAPAASQTAQAGLEASQTGQGEWAASEAPATFLATLVASQTALANPAGPAASQTVPAELEASRTVRAAPEEDWAARAVPAESTGPAARSPRPDPPDGPVKARVRRPDRPRLTAASRAEIAGVSKARNAAACKAAPIAAACTTAEDTGAEDTASRRRPRLLPICLQRRPHDLRRRHGPGGRIGHAGGGLTRRRRIPAGLLQRAWSALRNL